LLLQYPVACAAAAAAARRCGTRLDGPAYEVSPWAGPVSAFSLVDTNGKTWRAADLRGRAVMLNFWASWCEPCRAEMPTLQQVADFYGADKLLVLAINFKEPVARALQFAKTTGVTLPVLLDLDGKVARGWGVKVFPTTLMIDHTGRPRQRVTGEVDWTSAAAEKLIAGLLKP
jgi:thiol-disulfide isomerase/thioredoxin